MKHESYLKICETYDEAYGLMKLKNNISGYKKGKPIYVIVEHPDGHAVMDMKSAIDSDFPYIWAR
jgi:hypothetical protein